MASHVIGCHLLLFRHENIRISRRRDSSLQIGVLR
jgi:hypothetical protein